MLVDARARTRGRGMSMFARVRPQSNLIILHEESKRVKQDLPFASCRHYLRHRQWLGLWRPAYTCSQAWKGRLQRGRQSWAHAPGTGFTGRPPTLLWLSAPCSGQVVLAVLFGTTRVACKLIDIRAHANSFRHFVQVACIGCLAQMCAAHIYASVGHTCGCPPPHFLFNRVKEPLL